MENLKKFTKRSNTLFTFKLYLLEDWVESEYNGNLERVHKFRVELSVHHETFIIKINQIDNEFYCLDKDDNFLKTFYSVEEIKEWIEMGCLIFDKNLEKEM
jgi:hypothetical protein